MTKQEFKQLIGHVPIILDGAMGTGLTKAGMSIDECTEKWAANAAENFATEIGADAYAKDAADIVKVVERLLK